MMIVVKVEARQRWLDIERAWWRVMVKGTVVVGDRRRKRRRGW